MLKQNKRKARKSVDTMRNKLDGDDTKSYRMNMQFMCECVLCWFALGSHKYNSNSLAAVLHINKSNAAGNSKRLYSPELKQSLRQKRDV